jgi:hypothetical protein
MASGADHRLDKLEALFTQFVRCVVEFGRKGTQAVEVGF